MVINGGDTEEPGTALLIAAAPVGKGRLVDASSVLPALAAVPPGALTGTRAATVVELADPLDPQTVLTRIRAAATAAGPLFLYIAGQLQLDRKQRLLHLALARTTATTMRYTALPWHWLAAETAIRRPGTTTVVVDLVADADAWHHLASRGLALGLGVRLYGRVCPAPQRGREAATPAYLKACAAIWRSGARPDLPTLHEQAAARAGGEEAMLLAIGTPPRVQAAQPHGALGPPQDRQPPQDPHPAILAAARAGRHTEAAAAAAAWEQQELRTHGTGSVQAIHWLEVRADLARLAQDPARSCELWMAAAEARLTRRQATDDLDVEGAVDRAHHQWEQIRDLPRARALAPALVRLRRTVPGRQRGALQVLQRRLESLHTGPVA
ncbi:hypothetical protein FBY35_0822 [Streptomyces sp. SLBN-118]|uniref:hypothetical protein n=1 Tax=Streptomyces sp. SLBN-118 TaxID=2768454 RepID=UPI0011502C2A|nr:hypothetical protein [Streptomyces sp. SLBN-118]TQK50486.1 hypothetical protein FBY35_0822 [Streptomyces sp. SLBN-118]